MAKKRKSDASRLEEVDRSMYTTFCSAANSLSQLYSHSMQRQHLSFQAGERHALEKFYNWVLRQEESGLRVSSSDVMAYMQPIGRLQRGIGDISHAILSIWCHPLHFVATFVLYQFMMTANPNQNEMEEPPMSPRLPTHQQQSQVTTSGINVSSNSFGHGFLSGHVDQQPKNIFSNALSSPVRRSLQNYHLAQVNGPINSENSNNRNHQQTRDLNAPSANDSLMDMHAEDENPAHE